MDAPLLALRDTLLYVLQLYVWVLIASAIFSWLVAFNVVNMRNQVVGMIGQVLFALTEPVLAPIRRRLPAVGGLDLSPIVVIIAIFFVQNLLVRLG